MTTTFLDLYLGMLWTTVYLDIILRKFIYLSIFS
jgi:hypothetical protein